MSGNAAKPSSQWTVVDLINSPDFRRVPQMFVSEKSLNAILFYLRGYQDGFNQLQHPDNVLAAFGMWLSINNRLEPGFGYPTAIQVLCTDDDEGIAKFFSMFDDFQNDLAEHGVEGIQLKHNRYRESFRRGPEHGATPTISD